MSADTAALFSSTKQTDKQLRKAQLCTHHSKRWLENNYLCPFPPHMPYLLFLKWTSSVLKTSQVLGHRPVISAKRAESSKGDLRGQFGCIVRPCLKTKPKNDLFIYSPCSQLTGNSKNEKSAETMCLTCLFTKFSREGILSLVWLYHRSPKRCLKSSSLKCMVLVLSPNRTSILKIPQLLWKFLRNHHM